MTTATNRPSPTPPPSRSIWMALVLIGAVIVGASSGLLAYAGGNNVPMAVLAGGGAFGATVLLLLALLNYASGKH